MNKELKQAKVILKTLINNGFEAFFVGGCVRDWLMGQSINDIDITTSATPDEIEVLFDHTLNVGKAFGTIIVVCNDMHFEVTTFRHDGESQNGRHPNNVTFTKNLIDDLSRRDFTMNAIAMDVNEQIIDPFNGQNDIKQGIIKTVGNADLRFNEDKLRMLRALRFMAKFGFDLDNQLLNALFAQFNDINNISTKRIITELTKLLKSQHVDKAMELLNQLSQRNKKLLGLDLSDIKINQPISIELFFAILKQKQDLDLDDFCLTNKQKQTIKQFTRVINKLSYSSNLITIRRLIFSFNVDVFKSLMQAHDVLLANDINIYFIADNELDQINKNMPIHSLKDLAINGDDLIKYNGRNAGVWVGVKLYELIDLVLKDQVANEKNTLLNLSLSSKKIERQKHNMVE